MIKKGFITNTLTAKDSLRVEEMEYMGAWKHGIVYVPGKTDSLHCREPAFIQKHL